jgi:hypothetical protein
LVVAEVVVEVFVADSRLRVGVAVKIEFVLLIMRTRRETKRLPFIGFEEFFIFNSSCVNPMCGFESLIVYQES